MNTLVVGTTESGKTTLCTDLVPEFKREGFKIGVLTAVYDPRWQADFYTEDPEEFLQVFFDSTGMIWFIDEAGETVGRYNEAMDKVATRGRHRQHSVFFILQKATRISLAVRENCSRAFVFQSAPSTAKVMAEEFVQPRLEEEVPLLKQFEYIEVERFGGEGVPTYERGSVEPPKGPKKPPTQLLDKEDKNLL